jgi:hypothetical protein
MPLNEVFDTFLSIIQDTGLANMAEEDAVHLLCRWYELAVTRFKECKSDTTIVTDNDGNLYSTDDLTLEERNIIVYGMLYYWMTEKVNYNRMLRNVINTKDFNSLSPANILLRMGELQEYYRREYFRMRKAYTKRYDGFNGWS